MSKLREAVLEDVMQRILEEHGKEALALDWGILDTLVEGEENEEDQTE
jgi:hypothetical protein